MSNSVSDKQYQIKIETLDELLPGLDDSLNIKKLVEKNISKWSTDGTGNVYWGGNAIVNTLPPDLYRISYSERLGTHLVKQLNQTDDLIELTDSDCENVINEIENFWKLEEEFKKRGLVHKRGILMSGDPGSGKTSTIQLLIKKIINRKGIALYPSINPHITAEGLQLIRKIESKIPICLIMEDFDSLVSHENNEIEWLSILDGESQVDNIVFLATTNYISKLDKRFIDRPSRFDTIKIIKMPNDNMRRQYIMSRENMSDIELEKWVKLTKDLSLAHIKELIIAVKIFGYDIEETVSRLNKMQSREYSENDHFIGTERMKSKVGFRS